MFKVGIYQYLLISNNMESIPVFSPEAKSFQHGKYLHYKGGEYQTHFIARSSETLEEMIVYQDLREPEKVWCRPLKLFLESVEVGGEMVSRFSKIN